MINRQAFWTTVFWGASTLIISFILKLSPAEWVAKVPIKIDENQALGEGSKLVQTYERVSKPSEKSITISPSRPDDNDDDFKPPEEADNNL